MKKQVLIAAALMATVMSYGQKKELKKADKAVAKGDYTEAMTYLTQVENLLGAADAEQRAEFYVLKTETLTATAGDKNFDKLQMAAENLEMAKTADTGNEYKARLDKVASKLEVAIAQNAIADRSTSDFKRAAKKLETAYNIKKDTLYLYYAASTAMDGQDYQAAIDYYSTLVDLGYTGISTEYTALNTDTNQRESWPTAKQRDLMVKLGTHTEPKKEVSETVYPQLVKNLALSYVEAGDLDGAKQTFEKAKQLNPNDATLLIYEANIYADSGDNAKFMELTKQALALQPDNAALVYNVGVSMMNAGDYDAAITQFENALKLEPSNTNAALNLSTSYIEKGNKLTKLMNELGSTKADFAKYDAYNAEKTTYYQAGSKALEDYLKANPAGENNLDIYRQLKNIYAALDNREGMEMAKKKIEELGGE